ncbi:ABC transporter ATP-binding protein (plasmid) [Azospirillum oryzae]|uniref:Spermidine/putrescine import ATP-binding protein PotA n=1 Tax=Azospirillum oryzae TaxID=286727 RepID=A0A6N1AGL1_9PROT|nr:ABC transporter ATP-binding protein [Azospirillum oryzae]KAA0587369.1 ABC transporter ATP-binding protein [Azospirillum oryzae]QKS50573.1 ABC transporter ATP-binding protein [Azospirillum oryzae]GLR79144.1 polyamine-transporting ATPase [Azospirillum oryzae]
MTTAHPIHEDYSGLQPIRGGTVSMDSIIKHYGSFKAVDGVSLSVGRGEFVALLGPSGSGKTTLLMMIAGFEHPDSGSVCIDGVDVSRMPAHRRDVGMVFQKYALFPHMTILDNVAFPLRMRGVTTGERRLKALDALRVVGLEGMEKRLPAQLSGGQQQRVALARAIVYRPPVLLMDEPLGALDKKLRERMQIEIKHLQESLGATVIYVTHDQEEALTMADRIAVMNRGRLEQVGTPAELYERPANPFVASFIGETNLLDGELVATAGMEWMVRLAGGAVVRGTPAAAARHGTAAGARVRLTVRPERIELAPATAGGMSATVSDVIYAGPTLIYLLRSGGLPEITVRVPVQSDAMKPARGEAVSLTWDPANALVY